MLLQKKYPIMLELTSRQASEFTANHITVNGTGHQKQEHTTLLTLSHTNRFGKFGFTAALTRLNDMSYEKGAYSTRYVGYLKTVYNFSPASSLSFFANSLNETQGDWIYWKDLQNALIPINDYGQNITSERYMLGMKYNNAVSENFSFDLKGSFYKVFWYDNTRGRDASYADIYRLEGQSNLLFNQ